MMKKLYLFLFIFGIPLLGFVVASWIKESLNSDLHKVLLESFPDEDPAKIAQVTIGMLCEAGLPDMGSLCRTYDALTIIQLGSLLSGLLGMVLLAAISVAGRVARLNRHLLLWLFKPGLYLTAIGLVLLTIIDGGIATGTLFYGESALIGRVHVYVIILIGIGALYGVVGIIKNVFMFMRGVQASVAGVPVSKYAASRLWQFVEHIANRQGSVPPDHIIVGLEPNFFVTDAEVHHLNGTARGRTLYCSLPLMRLFEREEFAGVIGHELAHYKGEDVAFSRRFYPIYKSVVQSLVHLKEGAKGWRTVALLPAMAIFSFFLDAFAVAESAISRQRELVADAEGAQISSPNALASALLKVHALTPTWEATLAQAAQSLIQKAPIPNIAQHFISAARYPHINLNIQKALNSHIPHPTASHPPLKVRLEALGYDTEDLETLNVNMEPEQPAAELLDNPDELETQLSSRYLDLIRASLHLPPSVLKEGGE